MRVADTIAKPGVTGTLGMIVSSLWYAIVVIARPEQASREVHLILVQFA